LIDLKFASYEDAKHYDCSKCPSSLKKSRKCEQDGLDNLVRPISVDDVGLKLKFCPGKATWYDEYTILFYNMVMALETGILPKEGSFEDQDELFVSLFPFFVDRYRTRQYSRTWNDVINFTPKVLEAIGKMISRMFGGK
jgi:hypothetical protein